MQIGLLGGTGPEAKGLALRFALAGAKVTLGSRLFERAKAVADQYNNLIGRPLISGWSNEEMLADSEIVFLTVPFENAISAVELYRNRFTRAHVVVDVTVPMTFKDGQATYLERGAGSNAELIAASLDGTPLVAAFKTIPAHILSEFETPLNCDVFVCGDSLEAKTKVMEAAALIPTLRPLDVGKLHAARTLERMTVLAVNLNRRYKKKGARYHIEGI